MNSGNVINSLVVDEWFNVIARSTDPLYTITNSRFSAVPILGL